MNWKLFAGFVALILLFVVLVGSLMFVRRETTMTFLFTADTQGFLVPCGCKVTPAGGLARRAQVIGQFRADPDAGPVQPVEVTHGFADRGPGRDLLNAAMGEFFKRQGALVGLGSYDLLLGVPALERAAPGVPLRLAGLQGVPGSEEFRLGGWGIGYLGDRGARLRLIFLAETAPGGAETPDPVASFRAEAADHPAEGYLVTGQFSPKTAAELVKAEPRIAAVVGQWRTNVTTAPQRTQTAWILYLGDRGRRLARVSVSRLNERWDCLASVAYLGPDTPSDPEVEKGVKAVLAQVEAANRSALERASNPPVAGSAYVGSGACKSCHPEAFARWSASSHARAVTDLAVDHQVENPDCLICHATAFGEPGGYFQPSTDLSGVQCEACHGPGEGHPPKKLAHASADAARCGRCHGPRDSPSFALPGYWEAVKH